MDLPLHPMLVHLPITLALLVPVAAGIVLWRGRDRADPRRSWRWAAPLYLALAVSAWAAVATGEQDEDAVERIVPEAALEAHEDSADVFLSLAWAAAGIAALGLLGGTVGRVARFGATGMAALLLVAAVRVGHAGGQLVYRYGAAQAHLSAAGSTGSTEGLAPGRHGENHDSDDDD